MSAAWLPLRVSESLWDLFEPGISEYMRTKQISMGLCFLDRFSKKNMLLFFVHGLSGETSSTSDFNVERLKFPQLKKLREFSLQQPWCLMFNEKKIPYMILAKVLNQGHNVLK